jgi:MerR family transcriptional regulator, light-induced transcriptional regulator
MPGPGSAWMRIGELSRRVGVSPDALRMWERRYGLLQPRRTEGNMRLYSATDEARVRLMNRYLAQGIPAAQAAELVHGARLSVRPGTGAAVAEADVERAHAGMREALGAFEETAAQRALEPLFATYSPLSVVRDVVLPYLHEVGERWESGHATIAEEHFTSHFLHTRLLALARGWDRGLGPRAVLACAPGEQHTLGLIALGIALRELGWRITYLGADTPVAMVLDAARRVEPDLAILSASMPGRLGAQRRRLAEAGAEVRLALAGPGADAEIAEAAGAVLLAGDPIEAASAAAR